MTPAVAAMFAANAVLFAASTQCPMLECIIVAAAVLHAASVTVCCGSLLFAADAALFAVFAHC